MADYENLLDSIDAVIKSNNRREITGQILQNTLHQMVGSLGENYQLAGFATPTLDPNSPDQNVFYVTDEAGVYTNFDNITLGAGLSFLMWKNEEWTSKTLDIVTADWVDENYVSKAFLRKVFQFFDEDGVEIFPNDTESVIDNIKAMCGLWTEQYLSALGLGEGSTIPTTLAALNDVSFTYPLLDGQALVYDEQSGHWVNATIQSGVDMSVVWAALAAATNEQINISHLTTALNDYVTATSLATTLQSYVTTSALATELANYASQSWVETNYVSKAFFNSLFQAQDANGNAITPNNSGQTTIDRLKILVGAYTEQYLSALGLSSGGGGGGSSTLAGLNDVTITNPLLDGQALIYDEQSGHWVNGAAISMSAVWTALAAATSEQINSSHLTTALSGYVTTSALASELANYVTTSSLSTTLADYVTTSALTTTLADYGSKTWIDNNYVSKAFFNRLFQAFAPLAEGQTEPTQVEPNDTTTTIDNIKAMFGLWTEQYLSALGLSAGGGGGYTLNEPLSSINSAALGTPSQANVAIVWNGTAWTYGTTMSSVSWNDVTNKPTTLAGYGITDAATTSQLANYLPLSGGTLSGNLLVSADKGANIGSASARFYYNYLYRILGLASISASTDGTNKLTLPSKSGTIAVTSDIPTNNDQLTNGAGYITGITSSMVTTALGYTPANSSSLSSYLPLSGGTITNTTRSSLKLNNTINNTEKGPYIEFLINGDIVGYAGYYDNGTLSFCWLGAGSNRLFLDASGGARIGTDSTNYTVYHSGNLTNNNQLSNGAGYITSSALNGYATESWVGSYYLPLSGGVINGNLDINPISGSYNEGIRVHKASNGFAGVVFCDTDNTGTSGTSAGTWSVYSYNGRFGFSKNNSIYTDNSSVLCYYNDNWGIGTISPTNKLDVRGGISSVGHSIFKNDGSRYVLEISNGTNQTSAVISFNGTDNSENYQVGDNGSAWYVFNYKSYRAHSNYITYMALFDDGHFALGKDGNVNGSSDALFSFSATGDFYATGGVTALSDIRHKDILNDTTIKVEDIARMRSVAYRWNDGRDDNEIHVGSIAQDWQSVLPEVVMRANDAEGTLSLQYGVAALVSSITIAKKVVNHEERIKELEKENEYLREEISRLKIA